jgi:hypothetical protein
MTKRVCDRCTAGTQKKVMTRRTPQVYLALLAGGPPFADDAGVRVEAARAQDAPHAGPVVEKVADDDVGLEGEHVLHALTARPDQARNRRLCGQVMQRAGTRRGRSGPGSTPGRGVGMLV